MGRFARQLARRLHHDGHPWPDLAAALLTARGTAGLDTATFAHQLGIPPALLTQLEDGTLTEPSPRTATHRPAPSARRLAGANPTVYLAGFGALLNALAEALAKVGRLGEAAAAFEEADMIAVRLNGPNPESMPS